MKTCYAVCDSCEHINSELKVRIKNELVQLIQKDIVTMFLNGFEGANADVFEALLFEIGFSGEVSRMNRRGSMSGHYDLLLAIESGRTEHVIRLIRTTWGTNKKCNVIWI